MPRDWIERGSIGMGMTFVAMIKMDMTEKEETEKDTIEKDITKTAMIGRALTKKDMIKKGCTEAIINHLHTQVVVMRELTKVAQG